MVGGKNDSRVISLVKESLLITFSYLNEGNLESTLTSLDQELDNMNLINYIPLVTLGHCHL